jgi:hypothetical protein
MSELQKTFNRAAVCLELSEALLTLQRCHEKAKTGAYDEEAPLVMAIDFQQILMHLCLAWHSKQMTNEEIKALPQQEFERLANTVPNFGFGLTLMPGIDPETGS